MRITLMRSERAKVAFGKIAKPFRVIGCAASAAAVSPVVARALRRTLGALACDTVLFAAALSAQRARCAPAELASFAAARRRRNDIAVDHSSGAA